MATKKTEVEIDPGVFGTATFEYVSPFLLKPSAFNPDNRTDPRATKKLKKAVREAGRVLTPGHVTSDGVIMDCHRRTEVAKELGLAVIPVLRYSFDSKDPRCSQLFNLLNISGRAFKPADQLVSFLKGGRAVSQSIERDGVFLQDLLSDYEMELFVERGGSPFILRIAQNVARYCYPGHTKSSTLVRQFIRQSIVWLIELNQQQPVRRYMEEFRAPAKKLINFIENNQPIEFPRLRARAI